MQSMWKKPCWPPNFMKLFRTLGWQLLSSKGTKVTPHGQTIQDIPKFPGLWQPSGPQSAFIEKQRLASKSVDRLTCYFLITIAMQTGTLCKQLLTPLTCLVWLHLLNLDWKLLKSWRIHKEFRPNLVPEFWLKVNWIHCSVHFQSTFIPSELE